jgi:N-acyl-D-aspartate/D-glutamate deacylase
MLDVVIRGGEVIDGTGQARYRADVGIKDGRIVQIGTIPADTEATTTIDATGKLVAPGFVDVHTHFDAQIFWDNALTPSPLHGVTTVLAGNCGFTIAPLSGSADDADYLLRMLARVEGMPVESLQTGVPWNWKTTAEYFDEIEKGGLGLNAGFMIGHSAIRRTVMGIESTQRAATPNDSDGQMVPSRYGTAEELVELARVTGEYEGTSLELIPQVGPKFDQWAIDLMTDMSVAAQRPLNWNVMTVSAANLGDCQRKLEAADYAKTKGGKIIALTIPMSFGVRLSFASGFVLDAMPNWEQSMLLPRAEKLALFTDPVRRAQLNADAQRMDNPLRMVADWGNKVIFDVVAPENEKYRGRLVADIAAEQGRDAWDVLCDIAVADELLTSFGSPVAPETDADWQARLEVWRDGRAVIGASDAGAHLDLLASFNYSTELLGKAVRQRQLLSFEEAIHLMTDVQAQMYGLRERGRLVEGWHADVIVIDPETVASHEVAMRVDLPGGAARLYAEADGIDHVLVNGHQIVRDGQLTEARGGTLLRAGRDSANPSMA